MALPAISSARSGGFSSPHGSQPNVRAFFILRSLSDSLHTAEEVDRLTTVVEQAMKTLAVAIPALERIQKGSVVKMDRAA